MRRYFLAVLGLLLLPIRVASAEVHLTDYGFDCRGFLKCGATQDIARDLIGNLIDGVLTFITPLAVIVFLYGALRMVSSQGDEGKEAGRKALIYATLGLVFAMLTGSIMSFVCGYTYLLGGGSGTGVCAQLW